MLEQQAEMHKIKDLISADLQETRRWQLVKESK
jgi:hypothetical protein